MCHFCNTTPPKPYKILKHVLFPDVVLSLTCIYILVRHLGVFLSKKQQQTGRKKAISGTALARLAETPAEKFTKVVSFSPALEQIIASSSSFEE